MVTDLRPIKLPIDKETGAIKQIDAPENFKIKGNASNNIKSLVVINLKKI
jgi:hypothetical protein